MTKNGFMYILTNKNNTVLYIVVTSNLIKRMYEHKHSLADGFAKKYNVNKLVYFEIYEDIKAAIL
ncbi:GIY-YIG nuclease family protein [Francisella tularensis subsp. mediasiatica]|nr:GIY-YIG nuclease family protein [Francisella tularensis subsp. mediasiatica]RZP36635.1 GIY-YIG nuclease family protein [Francisella tularensis subsp. mediasiatica]RZP40229.1 GIY-YIG nuclease family protein [Francisella tularensis subsp. mediasiatica]